MRTPERIIFELHHFMVCSMEKGDMILMASDLMEGDKSRPGNNVYLCMVCESKEEIGSLFSKLGEGAMIGQPLKEEFFGTFGWLTDKYGISWQIVPTILDKLLNDPDPVKAQRVMEAMLQMKKLDIKGLKEAYEKSN